MKEPLHLVANVADLPARMRLFKWVAVVTMVLDHIDVIGGRDSILLHGIGRAAAPLFFLMVAVSGTYLSRNTGRYLIALFGLGVISHAPHQAFFSMWALNIGFTLGLGLLLVLFWGPRSFQESSNSTPGLSIWLKRILLLPVVLLCGIFVEYTLPGVLLPLMFAWNLRLLGWYGTIPLLLASTFFLNLSSGTVPSLGTLVLAMSVLVPTGLASMSPRGPRIFWYAFYPGHLAIFALLDKLLHG